MSEEPSKLDLLIKIMRMTESESEGVTLVAISKANAMLKAEGWDWERLLRGKVRIIADPFASAGAPKVQPAAAPTFVRPRPATPPTPQPAVNPWPGGAAPRPRTFSAAPKPMQPPPQQKPHAPAGPLRFRRASNNQWTIASHIRIDAQVGLQVTVQKSDGSTANEELGHFIEQNPQGYYLYDIAKASKWKKRHSADQQTVKDLL